MPYVLIFIAAAAVIGFATPIRERWLFALVVLLALGFWVSLWFGDDADYYDIGKDGAIILGGGFAVVFAILGVGGVSLGRVGRHRWKARRARPAKVNDTPPGRTWISCTR